MNAGLDILKNKMLTKIENSTDVTKNENSFVLIKNTDIDLSLANITDDDELNSKLRNFTLSYYSIGINQTLLLGMKYEELFQLLGNKYQGEYTKFLINVLNVNPRTALRYRNRYNLYNKCKGDYSKKIISLISDKHIECIMQNIEFLDILENKKITKEELIAALDNKKIDEIEVKKEEQAIKIPSFINNLYKKINKGNLQEVKKELATYRFQLKEVEEKILALEKENEVKNNLKFENI
ncbi:MULTISPECIES: hypothetical protein [unclassified Fusobacterium]|uniref:hypothetical protein n=1 Tax=unclassified Fusobacterium TaxID=2648384 RepID=UPI001B8AE2AE|nr:MULTISPECIES: hypothetical protein [unclassified Fusobacterium]MBR8701045.1 hypothetical protein [Fusobacterium sp. DD45]MBR8710817.1 hypothetical protein [Fusobacterium sp. DD28]MBR8751405.1 hypothetical protein [Fusobacterium sp. DD26]